MRENLTHGLRWKGEVEKQLAPMAKGTKEILGVNKLDVTTDAGFASMV